MQTKAQNQNVDVYLRFSTVILYSNGYGYECVCVRGVATIFLYLLSECLRILKCRRKNHRALVGGGDIYRLK